MTYYDDDDDDDDYMLEDWVLVYLMCLAEQDEGEYHGLVRLKLPDFLAPYLTPL